MKTIFKITTGRRSHRKEVNMLLKPKHIALLFTLAIAVSAMG
ncbi:hypothetical protein BFV94_1738 [Alteromonas macleodii]|uniref:Uncharacterized protein n=1 Tax=Alteromonas macleodii TaxID=28108 RepID=A0AB36FZT0_ALTMA|nr:hypothetical protein BFV95_1738 [Alteromonas macleodii]OES34990.1 hypothetical protein BFV94_1738 [Alteromonas macleodii]OES37361.1 hypothetical protein BFV93_1735 [Alteromonas macleodii]OES42825.1 hypothetical protein BFV96_1738 [Alteromonas macleodii]